MSKSQPRVQIHILRPEDEEDADLTDLGLVNIGGERHLFLKPQSFDSAVRQVRSAMPDLSLEQVERLVREHSEFKDFDELLGAVEPAPPLDITPMPDGPLQPVRPRGRVKRWVIAAALMPALAGSWALGRYTNVVDNEPVQAKASAPDATKAEDAPFADDKFDFFAGASKIECDPVSALEAECTDADGMVMSTKAATGPDSTIFTFSYGSEQIGLRIFYDARYAKTWARQEGSRELYRHLKVHGRYVLWGTDPKRIGEYMGLLREADHEGGPTAMGGASPLPPRLAALTLGTLGLNRQQVNRIIAEPAVAVTDAPALIAARLVLGLDTTPVYRGHDGDDIVALAMGIEPPATRGTGGVILVREPAPVPQTPTPPPPRTTTAPPPNSEPSTPAPTPTGPTAPTTNPSTPTTPTAPPTETTPPPAEPSTPPTTDPAPAPTQPEEPSTPPAEETPEPPVETPVEESPVPPPEDTPASVETPAEEGAPPGQDHNSESAEPPGQEKKAPSDAEDQDDGDDLLIMPSAWTVPAAA
ncbi:hypothetical protein ACFY1J_04965 [Streptomyces sp. NPDC001406]|uniref:hypothetical protein n=1 Tax=Streptomyces sp. NPDC001406 TaxID=3364572 RepID=UPI0036C90436